MAVSYTHLDVYKRQEVVHYSILWNDVAIGHLSTGIIQFHIQSRTELVDCVCNCYVSALGLQ